MCISHRLLEMSQESEMGWKEAVYQEREMVCLSGWFADTLLAYSASSSGGHQHLFFFFRSVFFFFLCPCVKVYRRIRFPVIYHFTTKEFCSNREHKYMWETNVLKYVSSTCVDHFKTQFPLKMGCEYAVAQCKWTRTSAKILYGNMKWVMT